MVVSKINNEINYEEKKQLHKDDIGKSTKTYVIELEDLNTNAIVGVGREVNKYIEKSVIYFPLYLVLKGKNKDSDETSFEKIGIYEIPSNELMNVLDEEGDLDLEKLEEVSDKLENELGFQLVDPLLFSYVTRDYVVEHNQSLESFMNEDVDEEEEEEEGDEPESDSDDEDGLKDLEEGEDEEDFERPEGDEPESDSEDDGFDLENISDYEEEGDSDDDDGDDDDDDVSDDDSEDDSEGDSEDDSDIEKTDGEESDDDSSEELDDEELTDFNYIYDNWLTEHTKDTNFNIVDNEGGGDCFFAVVRDAYASIDKVFSVKALRELLSREATMEVFQTYKELYRAYKANIKESAAQMKKLKKKNDQLQRKIESGMNDLFEDKKQIKLTKKERNEIVKEAKENKKKFDRLAKEKSDSELLMAEYAFMKGVKSLCDFKKVVKQSDFWAETWAISTLERLLNTKFIILSSEEYESGNKDGVLQCGQLNDSILQEKGEFKPDYYIIMEFTGGHYMLVTHKDSQIFTYPTIPESVRKMIVDKCLDGKENAGPYGLIPEFNEYKK